MVAGIGLRRLVQAAVGAGFAAVGLALATSALCDVGPGGEVRFSLFPLALTVFDPFVGACIGRSLAVATAAAVGARCLGAPLGRLVARSRIAGGRLGRVLIAAPVVVPPVFLALGLAGLPELDAGGERIFHSLGRFAAIAPILDWPWAEARGWLGWFWIGLIQGVGLIVLVLLDGLDRFDRAWYESAQGLGMSERAVWRGLVWPILRPRIARAVGLIFALSLVECGIPFAFGLRRSIGCRLVEAARGPEPFPRLAAWTLAVLGCLAVGVLFVRLWVGPTRRSIDTRGGSAAAGGLRGLPRRSRLMEIPALAVLGVWLAAVWLPPAGLARLVLAREAPWSRIVADFQDPRTLALLYNSLLVGLTAAATAWLLGRPGIAARGRSPRRKPRRTAGLAIVPPVLLGIAVLALPRMVELATAHGPSASAGMKSAAFLDPVGAPLRLLLAAIVLETARRSWGRNGLRSIRDHASERERRDSAQSLGAAEPRLRRFGAGSAPWAWPGLAAVAAALSVAPAIMLGPTAEGRTFGPGVVELARESAESRSRAESLALGATAFLLAGWSAAVWRSDRQEAGAAALLLRWCDLDDRGERLYTETSQEPRSF